MLLSSVFSSTLTEQFISIYFLPFLNMLESSDEESQDKSSSDEKVRINVHI